MIIYNVTIQVVHDIHEDWLQWMKTEHIPAIMQTGCFSIYQMVRLLETDETDGMTYAVQYYAESKANYNRYLMLYAPALRQAWIEHWGDKTVAFRSLMEIVH